MSALFAIFHLRSKACLLLSAKLGVPIEQITLVVTIFLTIPFCLLNYLIKGKQIRLLYSFILGISFQYSLYGLNIIHTIFSTLSTYGFLYFFGRKLSPFIVLIYTIIHLDVLHIYRMFVDYGGWTIDDPTTIYMMTLCKYTSIVFSYDDGKKDDKDIISQHHKKYKIVEKPTFLEFCSYIYFYPTALLGPFIEYKDFINFIEEKDCYKDLNKKFKVILIKFIQIFGLAFVFMGIYSFVSPIIPFDLIGNEKFPEKYPHLWQRFIFLYFSGLAVRGKYYSGWLLSYSTVIISGLAYDEVNKNGKIIVNFDKGSYGSIIYDEFGMNPKLKAVYWNQSVHVFLKYNVFTRLLSSSGIFKNNHSLDSFMTYIFSALWHGFYPTYYIGFFSQYLFEQCAGFLEQIGFYKFVQDKKYLWPFVSIKTALLFDGVGGTIYVLDFKNYKHMHKNLAGFPVYYVTGGYVIALVYNLLFKKKKPKKDDQKKEQLNKNDEKNNSLNKSKKE